MEGLYDSELLGSSSMSEPSGAVKQSESRNVQSESKSKNNKDVTNLNSQ
jgi:hypothetical protein